MEHRTLAAALESSGIRPTDERDLAAIEKTAEMLLKSSERVVAWLQKTGS